MTTNNEAFDKGLDETVLVGNPDTVAEWAWQAATAEANKRINALESEVERKDSLLRALENVADELKASNNTLVKVLRLARQKLMLNSRGFVYSNLFVDINEALKATPAESLQAHDELKGK